MPVDLLERARRYVATMEPSVSGQGGHTAAFKVACALVNGFDLSEEVAREIFVSEFNFRCEPPWSEKEIAHKLRQAGINSGGKAAGYLLGGKSGHHGKAGGGTGVSPPARMRKRQAFSAAKLGALQCGERVTRRWLAERSPVKVEGIGSGDFLDQVFRMGEKVLVFTEFRSQGQYGWLAGSPGACWGLPRRADGKPVPAELPNTAREGVWFLSAPVDGNWYPVPGKTDRAGNAVLSRRSGRSVVRWRYLVLESDEAKEEQWLNLLVQLPLPVVALYSSGGRSVHALVRVEADSKSEYDALRDRLTPLLSSLGADPAAMTGVRLTRLPGVMREGAETKNGEYRRYSQPRLQRLLFLNPDPKVDPIRNLPRVRRVKEEG